MVDAISGVEQRLTDILAALTPPQAPPQFAWGESDLGVEDAPPRITWVPKSGPVKGPSALGGDGVKFPRPLHSRNLAFDVHVWAAAVNSTDPGTGMGARLDMVACEALMQHLVAALHDTLHQGCYDVTSEAWFIGAGESNKLGITCVLGIVVRTPFVRETEPMQPITVFTETPVLVPQS